MWLSAWSDHMCASMINQFDKVNEVMMRVGALPRFTNNEMSYYLSWSTNGLINEYRNEADAIYEGKSIKVMLLKALKSLRLKENPMKLLTQAVAIQQCVKHMKIKLKIFHTKPLDILGI